MATATGQLNITRVLRAVWLNPGISRVDIAKLLHLNKSTISKIVTTLVDIGIVEEVSEGRAGPEGGRRPIHLQIRADWGCVMGIEIQTEGATIVGIDLHGGLFFSHTEPLDLRETDLVTAVSRFVMRFRPVLEATGMRIVGIGVGLPGFVDPVRGTLLASLPLEIYEPVTLAAQVQRRLGIDIPILMDNDANCGCWGELAFSSGDRRENFLFVLGERRKHTIAMDDYRIVALGLGLVLNGRLHHGPEFSAGEFRSVLFDPRRTNQFGLSDEDALLFLRDDDVTARIVDEMARHLAFLIHTLNLSRIVLGGPIETLADQIAEAVETRMREAWAYPTPVTCDIVTSRLRDDVVAYGAAAMFLEHLITFPDVAADREMARSGADLLNHLAGGVFAPEA